MKSDEKQFEENKDEKKKLESVRRTIEEIYEMKGQKSEAVCEKKIERGKVANSTNTLAAFERLKSFYLEEVKFYHYMEARFDSSPTGKNYALTKKALKRYSEEKIKEQITFYMESGKSKAVGVDYAIIFSEHSENAWLASKDEYR